MTSSHGLHLDRADAPGVDADLEAALARALNVARTPAQGSDEPAWRLYVLDPDIAAAVAWLAARRLEPDAGLEGARAAYEQWRAVPGWIALTVRRTADPERRERVREEALSAAQRLTLSLWSDGVPSNWVADLAADEPAFYRLVGADEQAEEALGVVLYGHPERPAAPAP